MNRFVLLISLAVSSTCISQGRVIGVCMSVYVMCMCNCMHTVMCYGCAYMCYAHDMIVCGRVVLWLLLDSRSVWHCMYGFLIKFAVVDQGRGDNNYYWYSRWKHTCTICTTMYDHVIMHTHLITHGWGCHLTMHYFNFSICVPTWPIPITRRWECHILLSHPPSWCSSKWVAGDSGEQH